MLQQEQNVIAMPGESVIVKNGKETAQQIPNAFTSLIPFDEVKHLLSDKPLRRPNRVRPIESTQN